MSQSFRNKAFGAMADKPVELNPEELAMQREMERLKPRVAIPSDAPVRNPNAINQVIQNADAADKLRQMQMLQDAEDGAAFEEPGSEASERLAKLRRTFGK